MEIEKIVTEAMSKYPDKIAEYKNGNVGLLGLFVGETMKMSKGKYDPKKVLTIVKEKLDKYV